VQIITTKERVKRKITHLVSTVANWVTLHLGVGKDLTLYASSAIKWDMKQSYARLKINSKKKKLRLLIKRRKINSLWPHVLQAVKRMRTS